MQATRALLGAVIVMGVLILLGTAVVIGEVARRALDAGRPEAGDQGSPTARPPAAVAQALDEPAGTRIISVLRQSDRLLALVLSGGGRVDRIVVWDSVSHQVVGRLSVQAPAAVR